MLGALALEAYRRAISMSDNLEDGVVSDAGDISKAYDVAVKTMNASIAAKKAAIEFEERSQDANSILSPLNVDFTVVHVPAEVERARLDALGAPHLKDREADAES